MVCTRGCGYSRDVVKPAMSYAELLEAYRKLKKEHEVLIITLGRYIDGTA
jgi:hypothetical protein